MQRFGILTYGVLSYIVFLASFLYAIGFVTNAVVPKGIDDGLSATIGISLIVNTLLLSVFAVQHSVMARPGFKSWWTRIVPPAAERSTYVLLSSVALFLIFWKWQPLPQAVWEIASPAARALIWTVCGLGWTLVLVSTFQISHFDLFGLRQVWLSFSSQPYTHSEFRIPLLYRLVRHPIMLGFIIAFWATPTMSVGHLFFAAVTTAYILIALQLEERDLLTDYGDAYARYRQQVRMLLPFPRRDRRRP